MIVHSSMAKKWDPLNLSVIERGIGGMPVWLKVRDTLPHICVDIQVALWTTTGTVTVGLRNDISVCRILALCRNRPCFGM